MNLKTKFVATSNLLKLLTMLQTCLIHFLLLFFKIHLFAEIKINLEGYVVVVVGRFKVLDLFGLLDFLKLQLKLPLGITELIFYNCISAASQNKLWNTIVECYFLTPVTNSVGDSFHPTHLQDTSVFWRFISVVLNRGAVRWCHQLSPLLIFDLF